MCEEAVGTSKGIVALIRELVRMRSRAGLDQYDDVLQCVSDWLQTHSVATAFVRDDSGRRIGVWGTVGGAQDAATYLLNATVDTAPFGDEASWSHPPLSGEIIDGWLYGRGSADSKAGVAIFCHLLAALRHQTDARAKRIAFLFDAEEHTGSFGGVRRFMDLHGRALNLAGAMIGYPGNDRIARGGRGVLRAALCVYGESAHTGSTRRSGINALSRAAQLINTIDNAKLPADGDGAFPLPPKITVTAACGGNGFSVVPDACELQVDIRLTPKFDAGSAERFLGAIVDAFDHAPPVPKPTTITWLPGWPAYQVPASAPVLRVLQHAAAEVMNRDIPAEIVGPSSVANYLSSLGVEVAGGFGVTYRNVHAVDECIAVDSVEPVFQVYRRAVHDLLAPP